MSTSDPQDDALVRLDDLRDLEEAAAELGVAEADLQADIRRGRFVARKVGASWITTTQEIERYRRENVGDEPELTPMDAEGDDGQVFGG